MRGILTPLLYSWDFTDYNVYTKSKDKFEIDYEECKSCMCLGSWILKEYIQDEMFIFSLTEISQWKSMIFEAVGTRWK